MSSPAKDGSVPESSDQLFAGFKALIGMLRAQERVVMCTELFWIASQINNDALMHTNQSKYTVVLWPAHAK